MLPTKRLRALESAPHARERPESTTNSPLTGSDQPELPGGQQRRAVRRSTAVPDSVVNRQPARPSTHNAWQANRGRPLR
ncbi:hypothetical protein SAMN04487905_103246 [Actinopolyspora xinjiangensis]|uniref:Uncharacterized protein n=1 Tax=Actinopolyspora xinjiangensis TaxID=405564 RepID=A0A1H0RVF6_9ACTN|nr:hypothetical protein SAMN04487905_103246 [Actinopolyspora xinjiangensis]